VFRLVKDIRRQDYPLGAQLVTLRCLDIHQEQLLQLLAHQLHPLGQLLLTVRLLAQLDQYFLLDQYNQVHLEFLADQSALVVQLRQLIQLRPLHQ
jgi:hypothetical protein